MSRYSKLFIFSAIIGGAVLIGSSIPLRNYFNEYLCYNREKPSITNEENSSSKPTVSSSDAFIEKRKACFLRTYQVQNGDSLYNSNIDNRFYLKELYDNAMCEPNTPLEIEWRRRVLMDYTPRGNVVMYYDAYKRAFSYYADISISYALLNAIAMKYVSTYKCRDFFIDESVCSNVSKSPFLHVHEIEDVKKEKKENTIDVKKGPFLQPKPKGSKYDSEQPRIIKTPVLSKNKFVCVGKMYNFSILDKPVGVVNTITRPVKAVKYGSFKEWRNLPPTKEEAPHANSFSVSLTNQ
jgi:hypothetical protein